MRIAVFSDTHGATEPAALAVRRFRPDMILHLGDCVRDAGELQKEFPGIALRAVRGNGDFASAAPLSDCFRIGPLRALMAHGHEYGVKRGLATFQNAARDAGVRLALFGHTHLALNVEKGGILFVNPGTAGRPPRRTWALLEITDEGAVNGRILDL